MEKELKFKRLRMSWGDFNEAVEEIAEEYRGQLITKIVGISRGGLPLAVKLSNLLDIPMTVLEWQTRDGSVQDRNKLAELVGGDLSTTLFVDDICDSGETIKQIQELSGGNTRWSTLINKKENIVEFSPNNFIGGDEWIVFPWET